MSELGYLKDFKTQMVNFLDELVEQFPEEPTFVLIRIFVNDKIPIQDVLGRFIRDCLPYKNYVAKKDDKFFLESDVIYQHSVSEAECEDEANKFRDLWKSNRLDDDDRVVIWDWFILFFKIAEGYYNKFGSVDGWEVDLEEEIEKIESM